MIRVADDGTALSDPERIEDADPAALRSWAHSARWLWDATAVDYPPLLRAGLRVERSHDVTLTERILLPREGSAGAPASAVAVLARRHGRPAPADADHTGEGEPALFDPAADDDPQPWLTVLAAWRDQVRRIGGDNALRLLVAAESASGLAAAEMGHLGLPLRSDLHRRLLERELGPRPQPGARPARLAELAERITAGFGFPVNPDSPADLRAAFGRLGFDLPSTRSWLIKDLDHPVAPEVVAYRELARLWTANGWNWLAEWVRSDRFHAEYVPGGVVSGRWAARGGGGLQIPKPVRAAVVAPPGHLLVVADAAQLEPRVLAAISADRALQAVSTDADLYTALAADGFGGYRAHAKLAMLGAMYGQTSGEAGRLLATLRRRYPAAMACVEDAARRGERGETVRSVLGRTSPPPSASWWAQVDAGTLPDATAPQSARGREIARSWGRFTRNFVVQASAADWASVWLSGVRRDLLPLDGPELVFFQHDELIVQTPVELADQVGELVVAAADDARRLVFPGQVLSTPVRPIAVSSYADAK